LARKTPQRILVLDVGGTHVKMRMGSQGEVRGFASGPKLTARRMVRKVRDLTADWRYEVISMGYPGIVFHGRITADPHNLGPGWIGFNFSKAFGRPVRILNDAAMQAVGSYEGGRMLFLGLGTGLGATLIMDGIVEPMEIGHMPYKHGRTYEDYVGERGRKRLGNRRWRKVVTRIVDQLRSVLEVDYVILGGGNVKKLKRLPRFSRAGDNLNAFIGGERLWQLGEGTDPLVLPVASRATTARKRATRRRTTRSRSKRRAR
jgi:polyphosphate glucokinase